MGWSKKANGPEPEGGRGPEPEGGKGPEQKGCFLKTGCRQSLWSQLFFIVKWQEVENGNEISEKKREGPKWSP